MTTDRMRLTTDPTTGTVTLRYRDECGQDRVRIFSTSSFDGRGYVVEIIPGSAALLQVCDCLGRHGAALMSTREGLADVIRRQYRNLRAWQKRAAY